MSATMQQHTEKKYVEADEGTFAAVFTQQLCVIAMGYNPYYTQ